MDNKPVAEHVSRTEIRAQQAKNRVSKAVSGRGKNTVQRERGARGRVAGAERRAGVTEIRLSDERLFRRSHSAHVL